jgi:acetyl esterase/lipase
VYVYFHAGGWMLGTAKNLEASARGLVKKHNMVFIAPSYRLTPENLFPAAVDDVWAWTQWVARHVKELAVGAGPSKGYFPAGDSVGGNMALASALKARDSPSLMSGVRVTGVHVLSSQLCSDHAIPEKYRKWYKSYEQIQDAPILNPKVSDAIRGKLFCQSHVF